MVVINSEDVSGGVLFTVVSGYTGTESYRWYVNDILRGTQDFYFLNDASEGDQVYVILDDHYSGYWFDGHFYGGEFNGYFYGGTFHYGTLNGTKYDKRNDNPQKFIQ